MTCGWSRITKYICSSTTPNLLSVLDPTSLPSGIAAAHIHAVPAAGQGLKQKPSLLKTGFFCVNVRPLGIVAIKHRKRFLENLHFQNRSLSVGM